MSSDIHKELANLDHDRMVEFIADALTALGVQVCEHCKEPWTSSHTCEYWDEDEDVLVESTVQYVELG